jgi:hypothetical protein
MKNTCAKDAKLELRYPLRTLQLIGAQLMAAAPAGLTEDEKQFLRARTRDDSGSLSALLSEMKRLTLLT